MATLTDLQDEILGVIRCHPTPGLRRQSVVEIVKIVLTNKGGQQPSPAQFERAINQLIDDGKVRKSADRLRPV